MPGTASTDLARRHQLVTTLQRATTVLWAACIFQWSIQWIGTFLLESGQSREGSCKGTCGAHFQREHGVSDLTSSSAPG